ncbi:unnamed protein product [Sphagnum balticum]
MATAFHGNRGVWWGRAFTGLVVASPQSEWCAALKRRDCQTLLSLLQRKDHLWSETDSNGRTVLHVAVMQGCSRLVNEVLRSVNKYNPPNTTSSLDMLLNAKDTSLCAADVFAIADIVGNADVRNLIINGLPANIQPAEFPEANVHLSDRIQDILDNLGRGGIEWKTLLEEAFEDDVDYNFVQHRRGLLSLHVACKHAHLVGFLQRLIRRTKNEGNHLLQALFELKDAQGRTLLHVAVEEDGLGDDSRDRVMANIVTTAVGILDEVPACNAVTSQNCLNARDLAGRTPLHRAVANKRAGRAVIQALIDHPMTDVNAQWRSDNVSAGNVTALHLAVLHNNVDAARSLLASPRTDGDIQCRLFIEASGIRHRNDDRLKLSGRNWTALELATIMGQVHMVDAMLEVRPTLNVDRCFHLAAARGDPQCLQSLKKRAQDDFLNRFEDDFAPFHFAVNATHPNHEKGDKINHFLSFENYVNVHGLERTGMEKSKTGKMKKEGSETHGYDGKKACINLLLQAGVDIWQPDTEKNIADPGFDAPHEARLWWYDKIAKEKNRAKAKINAAGTATAVVAALIATMSFNGHFSPLTGYDADMNYHEPITKFLVKVFVITNCVSFYVAMTSIMFAIVPSFPLLQEGLREELARSRNAVRNAIRALLLSIASFVVSFIFSSIAVMPNELKYKRLTIIPAVLGGVFCVYGFARVYSQALKFH